MNKLLISTLFFLVILLLGYNCAPHDEHNHGEEHHHHLLDKIKSHQSLLQYAVNKESIDTNDLIKVHAKLDGINDFFIRSRTEEIVSFPCTNCHNQPLQKLKSQTPSDKPKSHWDIHVVHANESIMNCNTCHSKSAMNSLVSLTGETISLDESYKLCAQCHTPQYNDWEGGAHGKQLNGWAPPRVATTCVSCHNPHKPAFPTRFPARLNTNDLEK